MSEGKDNAGLIARLLYRSRKARDGEAIVDEADLDTAIESLHALKRYHEAYSDARFAPSGTWEASDAANRLEEVHEMTSKLLS